MQALTLSKHLLMEACAKQRINCWLDASQKIDTQWKWVSGNLTSDWAFRIHRPSGQHLAGVTGWLWLESCPYPLAGG